MARYKMTKSKKKGVGRVKSKRRKRRVSGTNTIMGLLEIAAGATLGAVAGRESAILLGGMIPSLMGNPMIVGLAQLAGGTYIIKEVKGDFMKSFGYGLAANGGVTAVVSTGIISGPNSLTYRLNGVGKRVGNIKFIAGQNSRIGTPYGNSTLAFTAGLNGVSRTGAMAGVIG